MPVKLPRYVGGRYEIKPKIHPGRIAAPPLGVWVKDGQSYYQKDLDRQFFCWEICTQEYSVRGIPYGTLMTNNKGPGWYVAGQEVAEILTKCCQFLEESVTLRPAIDKYYLKVLIPIGLLGELADAIEREDNERRLHAQV